MYLSIFETVGVFIESFFSKLKLDSEFAELHGHFGVGLRKLSRLEVFVLELSFKFIYVIFEFVCLKFEDLVNIFRLLPDGGVLGLKGEDLLLFGFEGFFGLFLFFLGLSEIFDEILVVSSDFFGLIFDDIHLAFHLDDFIGR